MRTGSITFINRLVYWVTMVVTGFLGLRFVLRLFNASTSAQFVRWVYDNSQPLVQPFINAFPNTRLAGGFTIEFSTLFAIIVFALVGYLIMALVNVVEPLRKK